MIAVMIPLQQNPFHSQMIRRSQSRLRVRLRARLSTLTETRMVILYDLSMVGAKLHTDQILQPGAEAVQEWQGCEAFGKVVWMRAGFCGMSFMDPISARDLIATRDLHDTSHLQSERELSRNAAKAWVSGERRH